jgi:hypothetical protein
MSWCCWTKRRNAEAAKDDFIKSILTAGQNLVFASEAFGTNASNEADVEYLPDAAVYRH